MDSSNKALITTVIIFILVVGSVAGYVMINRWHKKEMDLAQSQTEQKYLKTIEKMESDIVKLQARLNGGHAAMPGAETFPEVFGTAFTGPELDTEADCAKAESEFNAFLVHLDAQPYIASRNLNGGSAGFFNTCASLLMANPPVNVAEMNDLYRLSKNMTHFFRVLGKDRLMLAREILRSESTVLEPAMAVFYTHAVECATPLSKNSAPLSLDRLYDYAGYFLNTLGGRSYLMRRDSKISTLTRYYAILVVDRANNEQLNTYGIDLRPHIDALSETLSLQTGLAYRDHYQSVLVSLKNKYA